MRSKGCRSLEVEKVYNKSCLEFMDDNIKENSIDLIIADPPYKVEAGNGGGGLQGIFLGNTKREFFNYLTASDYMSKFKKILKPSAHVYVYSNDKNLLDILHQANKAKLKLMNVIVLNKGNKVAFGWFMKQIEFLLLFRNTEGKAKQVNNMSMSNLINVNFPKGKQRKHPSEKSVEIAEIIINQSSNVGELVYIPFAGSGSEIEACIKNNRKWVATELDEKYITEIIMPRIG